METYKIGDPVVLKLLNSEILVCLEKKTKSEFHIFYNVTQLYLNHQINQAFLKEWIPGVPPNEEVIIYPDRILAFMRPGEQLKRLYRKNFYPFNLTDADESCSEIIRINPELTPCESNLVLKI